MFDIIGRVLSIESRTNSSGRYSWTEIVIRESSAEETVPSATETNDIPLRFPMDFCRRENIGINDWVKVRFALVSRIYQRNGRTEHYLDAKGVAIKLLYKAKAKVEEQEDAPALRHIADSDEIL